MQNFRWCLVVAAFVVMPVTAAALIKPDMNDARLAMKAAGYDRVRVLYSVMPCFADALYLRGVTIMVYMDGANRRNVICQNINTGEWVLAGKFEGL